MKHTRPIVLEDWQVDIVDGHSRSFVKALIESDGCRFTNPVWRPLKDGRKRYTYTRYNFSNRSEDIKRLFCDALDRLGIEWRVMNASCISIARRASVEALDRFIGPKN